MSENAFYVNNSGLIPAEKYTIADHKRAYYASTGGVSPRPGTSSEYGVSLDVGCGTMPSRQSLTLVAQTSGLMFLSYFRAPKSFTATKLSATSGSTPAAATPTLCRFGLYKEEANKDLTLIGSTVNNTALFATANTRYEQALSAPVDLIIHQRYAVGVLIISAVAMPNLLSSLFTGGASIINNLEPKAVGSRSGLADLPASMTGVLSANGSVWHEVLV